MRNTEKYAGKRVLVVGMARSGIAAAQLLCKAGARVIINDSKTAEQLGDSLKPLENLPLEWRLGCPAMACLDGIDAMVISPVVPDNAPFVLKAKEMGASTVFSASQASEARRAGSRTCPSRRRSR